MPEARESYERALSRAEDFYDKQPENRDARRLFVEAARRLAEWHQSQGDLRGAHGALARAHAALDTVVDGSADDADAAQDLAVLGDDLGDLAMQMGDPFEAREAFEHASRLFALLREASPDDANATRDLAVNTVKLGDACRASGEPDDARDAYERADAVFRLAERLDVEDDELRLDHTLGLMGRAAFEMEMDDYATAGELYEQAAALCASTLERNPKHARAGDQLAGALLSLARLCAEEGDDDAANQHVGACLRLAGELQARGVPLSLQLRQLVEAMGESLMGPE